MDENSLPPPEQPDTAGLLDPQTAAQAIWDNGLGEECSKQSGDPYTETIDLSISGRDGQGPDFVKNATEEHWFELTDALREDNWHYIDSNSESSFEELFKSSISPRGPCSELWGRISEALDEVGLDEDDFKREVCDAAYRLSIEGGASNLFDLEYRLRGSCEGTVELNFNLKKTCIDEASASIPNLGSDSQAREWVCLFRTLNVDPLAFAKLARERILTAIDSAEISAEQKTEAREQAVEALAEEGFCDPDYPENPNYPPSDPKDWTGGMARLASEWAKLGASLPSSGRAGCDLEQLIEALSSDNEGVDLEIYFGIGADELTEHSEMLDFFGDDSPICFEKSATRRLEVFKPRLYIDDDEVGFSGRLILDAKDIRWSGESADDENSAACMARKRSAAKKSQDFVRMLGEDFKSSPSKATDRCLKAAKALCYEDSACAQDAFERLADFEHLPAAVEIHAAYQSTLESRVQRQIKMDAPLGKPGPLAIEDFDAGLDFVRDAPWRMQAQKQMTALCQSLDTLGNTIAHKACAGFDPSLLKEALRQKPALADACNLAGLTPFDLVISTSGIDYHSQAKAPFSPLALAMLSERPDLANKQGKTGTILGIALNRHRSPTPDMLKRFMQAGCDFGAMDSNGEAAWSSLLHLGSDEMAPYLDQAIACGWNINQPDGNGNGLVHKIGSLATALMLLSHGADFSIQNKLGEPGGAMLLKGKPADYAQLEERLIEQELKTTKTSKKPLSL